MRRLFWLVAAVVLVDTMFFAAVAPLLPHYSDELDLSKTGAGILTAAYPAGTFVGALPSGWLAVRWGVKPTLLLGLAMLGLASISFAFAQSVVVLDTARFIQGVGGACMWAAGMAWLISAAPVERRGELIGAALSAAIVGVLLGPVLGGAASVLSPELVFSSVAVVAAGLAAWAWTMPGVEPEESPGIRANAARAGAPGGPDRVLGVHASGAVQRRRRGAGAAPSRRPRGERRHDRRRVSAERGRGGGGEPDRGPLLRPRGPPGADPRRR